MFHSKCISSSGEEGLNLDLWSRLLREQQRERKPLSLRHGYAKQHRGKPGWVRKDTHSVWQNSWQPQARGKGWGTWASSFHVSLPSHVLCPGAPREGSHKLPQGMQWICGSGFLWMTRDMIDETPQASSHWFPALPGFSTNIPKLPQIHRASGLRRLQTLM